MVLYAYVLCFMHSRFVENLPIDLEATNPSVLLGSDIFGTRAGLGLNIHSKHIKITTTLTARNA
jgi:hypothetical protein